MCGFPCKPVVLDERKWQVPGSSDERCPLFAGVVLSLGSSNAGDFCRVEVQAELT
jgi:hypothetical protein